MKTNRIFALLLISTFVVIFFGSCTWHNEEEYFADTADSCSTTNMSFQTDVYPVIESSCVSCHNTGFASAGVNLEGYEKVKTYALSGKLSKVINHKFGVAPMPKNADKLPYCTINKIDAWIEQGYKNN